MKPITGEARYLWNFGDGSVTEGPSVTHTFHFPGVYTTSLNVVSGEAIGSALFDVRVEKNYIHLSEAVPGSGGFIELENASSPMIDLTGWVIADDAGKQFSLPQGTMLRGHSLFLLPNITSGLLLSNAKGVSLRYGNLQNVESVLLLDYSGVLATARFGDAWRTAPPSPGVSQLDADKKQPALETRETLSQTPDLLVSRERAGAVPSQVIEKDIEPAKLATASALAAAADVGNAGLPLTAVLLGGSLLLGILGGVVFIFLRRREIHA
ncbi:MAG: lamin tail domain-containing protein [Candidatus Sungbacteria bacterium]|uniref:Lamin tail domain-containing protein n=1 Tax=Candidatus Sungiibacteriota bacterium TaxID=2750080 RepID=A0A931SBG8_9BACT|nr:lamin tail domain-containing protein [Candidatus Sungbacteria bacterium]